VAGVAEKEEEDEEEEDERDDDANTEDAGATAGVAAAGVEEEELQELAEQVEHPRACARAAPEAGAGDSNSPFCDTAARRSFRTCSTDPMISVADRVVANDWSCPPPALLPPPPLPPPP